MPPWITISFMLSGLAFVAVLAVLGAAIVWYRPANMPRLALILFLTCVLALISLTLLLNPFLVESFAAAVVAFLLKLAISVYGLVVVTALLLVLAWLDLLTGPYLVLMRGLLILWLLLMRPLWMLPLGNVIAGLQGGFRLTSPEPVVVLAAGVLLAYQLLTIGLVVRCFRAFSPKGLLVAVIILQGGCLLMVLLPALREPPVMALFALPAAGFIGASLLRERRAAA